MAQPLAVKRAAVIGGGAFGTSLSLVLARKGAQVTTWLINKKEADQIQQARENVVYLKGVKLPDNLNYTADLAEAVEGAELILLAVPTQFLRGTLKKMAREKLVRPEAPLLLCCKGIELGTMKTPYDIVEEAFPGKKNIGALCGPSFAIEVSRGQLTCVTCFSHDIKMARFFQAMMTTFDGSFRCFAGTDVYGAEISSAIKNVIAIACGICEGLGYGENARAAVISRGLTEIQNVAKVYGSDGSSLGGLAGIGDLVLTASSKLSRNFTVGFRLGKGEKMDYIMKTSKAVAEGVPTAKALFQANKKFNVDLPICDEVYRIVHEGKPVRKAISDLLSRPLCDEFPKGKQSKL